MTTTSPALYVGADAVEGLDPAAVIILLDVADADKRVSVHSASASFPALPCSQEKIMTSTRYTAAAPKKGYIAS